jgi:glycosyltransferase involved in cell wall biosynthesis
MTSVRRVSIVIPTLNAGALLERLLAAVEAQDARMERELIAVDSGSTDGTLDRLRAYGATVRTMGVGEFNHGTTRNAALSAASGDVAVLLVQDAVPASTDWLRNLIEPLQTGDVAGCFARQVPWPDASRLTAHYLSSWVAAQPSPRIAGPLTNAGFSAMRPSERHSVCAFDNVCSCIRMDVWRKHPFRRTPIAEDLHWAAEVMLAGYRLAYAANAVVWHSHDRSVRYELDRTYLVHQQLQQLFGLSTIPTAASLVRSVARTLPLHVRLAAGEPGGRRARELVRGAGLAVALPLGQYLGARSAREGRELLTVRRV